MTREEAIKRIETHIAYHQSGAWPFTKTDEAMQMAIAALREQAGKDTNVPAKWISVEEGTPKDEQRVLVKVPEILGSPHVDTDRFVKGRWVRWGNEKVTHWKPLSE